MEVQKVERSAPIAVKRRLEKDLVSSGKVSTAKRMRPIPVSDKPVHQPEPTAVSQSVHISDHSGLSLPILRISQKASVQVTKFSVFSQIFVLETYFVTDFTCFSCYLFSTDK